jgi:anti-sigma factor RsiW
VAEEREVGGLRCSEVLAVLSEFVDGELGQSASERVLAHLRGCDTCERFGGEFSGLVKNLRERLGIPRPVPPRVAEELDRLLGFESPRPEDP